MKLLSFVLVGLCLMTIKCAAGGDEGDDPIKPPPMTPIPPGRPPPQPQPSLEPENLDPIIPKWDPNAKFVYVNSTAELEDRLEKAGDKLVVLVFFAEPRGSCKKMQPFLEQLAGEHRNVKILKVNIDDFRLRYTLRQYKIYNIKSMPIYVFLRKYKELHRFSGTDQAKFKENLLNFM